MASALAPSSAETMLSPWVMSFATVDCSRRDAPPATTASETATSETTASAGAVAAASPSAAKAATPTAPLDPIGFQLVRTGRMGRATQDAKVQQEVDQSAADGDQDVMIAHLKLKKAWDVAMAPAKSIPMNAFMLWMSGNSIQIFSILITVMMLLNSVKAAMAVRAAFAQFEKADGRGAPGDPAATESVAAVGASADATAGDGGLRGQFHAITQDPLLLPKIVFCLTHLGSFALGVWKCGAMGLLPTATSDWLAFLEPKSYAEASFGAVLRL